VVYPGLQRGALLAMRLKYSHFSVYDSALGDHNSPIEVYGRAVETVVDKLGRAGGDMPSATFAVVPTPVHTMRTGGFKSLSNMFTTRHGHASEFQ
jgi:hypothetical protein